MSRYILVLGVIFSAGDELLAQGLPPIQTDRPDQTECPFIVPKNHVQVESGFSYEHTTASTRSYSYPSLLSKYGVNDRFEFRLITEFGSVTSDGSTVSGLSPVTVGFKVNLAQEKGIIPTTSFIGHLSFPKFASENLKTTYFAPAFRFTMQHSLSDRLSLAYNLGAEWDGTTPEPVFIYTLTSGCSISDKVGAYVEVYGFAPQYAAADHRFDGGFNYLVQQNILVDISGGFGITSNAPDYYMALGFSFRLRD